MRLMGHRGNGARILQIRLKVGVVALFGAEDNLHRVTCVGARNEYGLRAEGCVFVDDATENVEAAKRLGFEGIVFTSYDGLIAELEQLGIRLETSRN